MAGCGDGSSGGSFEPGRAGTLTVMTEPLPTQGLWEGAGTQPTGGLEFGMARALARELGLDRVAVRTEPFSAIVSGRLEDADVALALITPTDERDEVLDFTTPYIDSPPVFLARDGTEIPDVQTAQELRIAVGAGTTFERIVREVIQTDAPALRFEDRAAELDAVRSGAADAAMFDLPAAQAIANSEPGWTIAARLSDSEPIAAALPEGSANVEAVSSALRRLSADGTLDRLAERWIGASLSAGSDTVPLLRTHER